jgi:hypothetical protein
MKRVPAVVFIGLAILLVFFLFYPKNGKGYGSISGKLIWFSEARPCSASDTCVFVVLFKGEEQVASLKNPCPIWPPDTCNFLFEKQDDGDYKVGVMADRSEFSIAGAKPGLAGIIAYYTNGKDSVAVDSTYASVIRLDRKNPNATSVDIVIR